MYKCINSMHKAYRVYKERSDAGEVPRIKVKLRKNDQKIERSLEGFSHGPAIRIVHSVRLLEKDVGRVFRRGGNSSRRKRDAEIGREAAAEIAEGKNQDLFLENL